MLFALLFLPLTIALPASTPLNTYSLNFEYGVNNEKILKDIEVKGSSITELNLFGMDLYNLKEDAFSNVRGLKSLNLSNNHLRSLPTNVFSKLNDLEYLSLAKNDISNVSNLFADLKNLRTLDLSHNSLHTLYASHLYGLTKDTKILTEGNDIYYISTSVFLNKSHLDEESADVPHPFTNSAIQVDREAEFDNDRTYLKLCMSNNVITSLAMMNINENLPKGCLKLSGKGTDTIQLHSLNIGGFQKGWYQLGSLPVSTLDFLENDITEISKETLNDLPESVTTVRFITNKIQKIRSDVIENQHIRILYLDDNQMEKIEDGAFAKTKLTELYLTINMLTDLSFVSSLPGSLVKLSLQANRISSIPEKGFLNLPNLSVLFLEFNKIDRLQNNAFEGLDSLRVLSLSRNEINRIEPDAFKHLKQLEELNCDSNRIKGFEVSLLYDQMILKRLNLSYNKLKSIPFKDLPKTLEELRFEYNEMGNLEKGMFVDVPRKFLDLSGNKLSSIPRGAINLPTLEMLDLADNKITSIDSDSYENLTQLKKLILFKNEISQIRKGDCKNFGNLEILDVAGNSLRKLENGALHGLSSNGTQRINIGYNEINEIDGGVFDNV